MILKSVSACVDKSSSSIGELQAHASHSASSVSMAEVGEKKYALSCEILGHTADVRAVSCVLMAGEAREHVVTGSRDGTACVWRPDPSSNKEYLLHKVIRKHTGYVSSLCVIPPDPQAGRPHRELLFHLVRTPHEHLLCVCVVGCTAQLATGSQDTTILIHSFSPEVKEPLERYVGHKDLVTAIVYQHGQLVSGSWDRYVCHAHGSTP